MNYVAKIRAALLDAPLSSMETPAFAKLSALLDALSAHHAHSCDGCGYAHTCETREVGVRCVQWHAGRDLLEQRARLGAALAREVMGV